MRFGPNPLPEGMPSAVAEDVVIAARIDAAVVGNGPGAWVYNPPRDEYRVSVSNRSARPVEVTALVLYDPLDNRIEPAADFRSLVAGTQSAARRYLESEALAKALPEDGWGFRDYFAVASGSVAVGVGAAGLAVLGTVFAPLVVPVIVAGGLGAASPGLTRSSQESTIDREIARRRTALPVPASGGANVSIVLFFPVTPLPRRVAILYTDQDGPHQLDIDTSTALAKAHVEPPPLLFGREEPVFSQSLRDVANEGYVKAKLTIGSDGLVRDVKVLESVPQGVFDWAATKAFYRWRFDWGRSGRTAEHVVRFDK